MKKLLLVLALVAALGTGCVASKYDKELTGGQSQTIERISGTHHEEWRIMLGGGGWVGADLTVDLKIENNGEEIANFGAVSLLYPGLDLVAVDRYDKIVEPEGGTADAPYKDEYYPDVTREVTLHFSMDENSGSTRLFYRTPSLPCDYQPLFDVGSPAAVD